MNIILNWESQEQLGFVVTTPTQHYKWNNLSGLYESFYKQFEGYTKGVVYYVYKGTANY